MTMLLVRGPEVENRSGGRRRDRARAGHVILPQPPQTQSRGDSPSALQRPHEGRLGELGSAGSSEPGAAQVGCE